MTVNRVQFLMDLSDDEYNRRFGQSPNGTHSTRNIGLNPLEARFLTFLCAWTLNSYIFFFNSQPTGVSQYANDVEGTIRYSLPDSQGA
jgi:hypothetical protein